MKTDFILFFDTETSGLPKKWNAPYSSLNNWPSLIQLAWIITDINGNILKKENFYLQTNGQQVTKSSYKIHKISNAFIQYHGKKPFEILKYFYADLQYYKPLLVGHFLELDIHMIKSESYKSGINAEIINNLPKFCTMLASKKFVYRTDKNALKLNEFYNYLFNEQIKNSHHALSDSLITKQIFFELLKRNEIEIEDLLVSKNEIISVSHFNDIKYYISYGIFISIILIALIIILWKFL